MANTYTQVYIQFVFAVKYRKAFLVSADSELHQYINGIIRNIGGKPFAVNNMPDHIHILLAMPTTCTIAKMAQTIKNNSSSWLKSHLDNPHFAWQTGYGAFSYARSQFDAVFAYIANQQHHHRTQTFHAEYLNFLRKFAVDFDEQYLFEFFD